MDSRALQHALESGGRFRIFVQQGDEVAEIVVDIVGQAAAQLLDINPAGAHDGDGVLIFGQGQQQVLQRRVFMAARSGMAERAVQSLFESLG